ncbi:hypothetical protein GQ56_0104195 [Burkholderia paludis]|uniref:Peptidase n=1 Tax=Burkholderia paludis TaxID=1506587 RepID=A0A6P2HSX9_9BURK|nr:MULTISPECIES: hypothetical protein [Burkholderia]KFG98266.1 hypothetical protein GQ56_0104195 [Burkholderia paludis]CAB3749241.1 hypothetical protein LMG30113_00832 [Burkholderia paludis]VWB20337.1 peptidase [Burkholderia paludis]
MRLFATLIWSLGVSGWLPGCGRDRAEPVMTGGLPAPPPGMQCAASWPGVAPRDGAARSATPVTPLAAQQAQQKQTR